MEADRTIGYCCRIHIYIYLAPVDINYRALRRTEAFYMRALVEDHGIYRKQAFDGYHQQQLCAWLLGIYAYCLVVGALLCLIEPGVSALVL